jgi:hypothetical protein
MAHKAIARKIDILPVPGAPVRYEWDAFYAAICGASMSMVFPRRKPN